MTANRRWLLVLLAVALALRVGYVLSLDPAEPYTARGGDNRPAVISTAARAIYDGFGGEGQGLAAPLGGRAVQASSWREVPTPWPRTTRERASFV